MAPLDEQDLHDLFSDFVSDDFEIRNDRLRQVVQGGRQLKVSSKQIHGDDENVLPVFTPKALDHDKAIEITVENWPRNQNYRCDSNKLQLNSSFPFFICIGEYNEFLEAVNSIEWMADLKTCLRDMSSSSEEL